MEKESPNHKAPVSISGIDVEQKLNQAYTELKPLSNFEKH